MIPIYRNILFLMLMLCCFYTPAQAKTVTDQAGRTMTVPDDPKRVVALAPSITEIIFALNQQDHLVGVTRFSDYPEAALKYPKVGSYVHLDLEKIIALNPDLCIAIKDGNPIEVVARLENMKVPVYAVDPINLDTVMQAIYDIGGLLNTASLAEQKILRMQEKIKEVKLLTQSISQKPGVFFQIGISPIVAVGTDTFIHELITTAGGRNLTAGSTPYPRFSWEQIIALAPDVMIITSMAREEVFDQVKRQWEKWPNIPAVRNNRIHLVDSNLLDRPTPRMADGLKLLFNLIHPGLNSGTDPGDPAGKPQKK